MAAAASANCIEKAAPVVNLQRLDMNLLMAKLCSLDCLSNDEIYDAVRTAVVDSSAVLQKEKRTTTNVVEPRPSRTQISPYEFKSGTGRNLAGKVALVDLNLVM